MTDTDIQIEPTNFLCPSGVREGGLVSPSVEGTPQGGPLSPLLSNLVLDELDRELERRGHRFVRYADDSNIYVRSERAGQRVMESVKRFITEKRKLKVNESKSAVAKPQERKFLGFSFTGGKEPKRKIAPKAIDRFKERIREITHKAKGQSTEQVMAELAYERSGPERYLSCYPLLRELMALLEHDATERQRVQIGYEVARLATLRVMSLSVAGMLGAGANPALEASVVKDQGALFEQALPGTAQSLIEQTPSTDADASDFRQMLGHLVQNAPSYSLRGGTREILRGIIARGLGLR